MYAIETTLGRFEAETEKQAKALLRKASKAYEAKRDLDYKNYQLAHVRAQAQAYAFMERLAKGETTMPRGWRIKPIDSEAYCVREVYADHRAEWIVETGYGKAQSHFHGSIPREYIEAGNGYCLGLVFRNANLNSPAYGERIFYAVGIEADQVAIAEIHGLSVEAFPRHMEESAVA